MTYTGYTYEELLEMQKSDDGIRQLLEETDTLVDGRFVLAQRDLTLIYKGSRNQRVIDLNRTRAEGHIVLDRWRRRTFARRNKRRKARSGQQTGERRSV